ncbi:hypothetical protein [Poseidonibacter lekithochrous]|uniref:hypothetical protein n=1 Tax=Poseidonibacter lekithochrous TaxID=1904463 RepID=UPI0008FCBBBE|nr:hypothetical protein [Poseidonibacter lekithochrous]QKJ22514.1 hypothetical protein ALEK_1235 [Poseidonibacter lekithochrous]
MKKILLDKLKSKLALLFILICVISGKYWLFGFLFLVWTILDIRNRQTYLLEIIQKDENPILYWIIVITWFTFAILSFFTVSS